MNVHPSDSIKPPGPTTDEAFAPGALYELRIDTDGDAVADFTYQVRFSSSANGAHAATLRRVEGGLPVRACEAGQVIFEGVPVSTGRESAVAQAG